jgi:hypothetical protein
VTIVVWAALLVALAGGALGSLAFRKLVDIEFSDFHDEWLKDGRPIGGAQSRKAAPFWRSGFATQGAFQDWLVVTPAWATASPVTLRLLTRFRIGAAVLAVGVLALIAVTVFFT